MWFQLLKLWLLRSFTLRNFIEEGLPFGLCGAWIRHCEALRFATSLRNARTRSRTVCRTGHCEALRFATSLRIVTFWVFVLSLYDCEALRFATSLRTMRPPTMAATPFRLRSFTLRNFIEDGLLRQIRHAIAILRSFTLRNFIEDSRRVPQAGTTIYCEALRFATSLRNRRPRQWRSHRIRLRSFTLRNFIED